MLLMSSFEPGIMLFNVPFSCAFTRGISQLRASLDRHRSYACMQYTRNYHKSKLVPSTPPSMCTDTFQQVCKIEKKKGFVGFFPKLTYLYSAGGSAVRPSLTPSNTYIKSTPDHSCIMKTESDQLCVISAQCNSGALGMNSVCTVLGKDRGQLLCCEPRFLLIKPSSLCATLLQRLVL